MGKKHGVWFDLIDHISIHDQVIEQNKWLIKSGQDEYTYQRLKKDGIERLKQDIVFETHNGCQIEISKETLISNHNLHNGMTTYFRYNCLIPKKNYHLRYHAAHGTTYNPNAPWHDKPHKHEFDGKTQKIDVYSHDHRPTGDQKRTYTWKAYPVILTFLNHEDWPFVSEFLDEISAK
jgi:hypothetical protein